MTLQQREHWDEVFRTEFERESDRACVILAAAMLDQSLETLLKARLVPISKPDNDLFNGVYAPLSTFDARIDTTHRIGLISTNLCRDLHIIRKIRNDFAHNITGCSFEDSTVRSRVMELQRSLRLSEREPQVRKRFLKGVKGDFQMVVSWMLWHLWSQSSRIDSMKPRRLEPPYWTTEELKKAEAEYEKKQKMVSGDTTNGNKAD